MSQNLILTFYTLTQAAKELGCTRQALHELYKRGRLPFEQIGNKVMVTGGTVAFLKRNPEIRIDRKIAGRSKKSSAKVD
jgi:excisionase family DNA binding protein